MNELITSYNDFMKEYTNLDINTKRSEIINKIKELTAFFQQLAIMNNIDSELLINREILDLNKEPVSEDDYLEGLFAHINMLEDIIGKALINTIKN